jgi:protein involved in polysaccharide export with SLBB domain
MNVFRILLAVCSLLVGGFVQAQDDDYVLDTGDTISIRVHGEPDLTFEAKVGTNGVLLYPFLGEITLKDRTAAEIRWLIDNGLRGDYLLNPEVDVSVIEYRPFYILGEVQAPKNYPYQPGLTVSQAIAIAGGLTERGSEKGIQLKRKLKNGKITVEADIDLDKSLQPGDVITVKQSFF